MSQQEQNLQATPLEAPEAAPAAAAPPVRRRRARGIEVALVALSLAIVVLLASLLGGVLALSRGMGSLFATTGARANPPAGTYSILYVEGTIATGNASGYQHTATVGYIKALKEDEGNLGILLYLNTGGGGVYESDETYRALMDYKEATGRPVWAYMGRTCASGGVYIAAAADRIYANPGTTTGSIGVYYQFTDASELYEKLGIETVLIRSGENKGVGVEGAAITEENRAVYQAMVDESYERFVDIVADCRGMSTTTVRALADGRPFTANQALANGLVDDLCEWESAQALFDEHTGGSGYATNFVTSSQLSQLVRTLTGEVPKSESEALLELAESQPSGLMAHMDGLW